MAPDRLTTLREAFRKTMNDPQFQEEVKRRKYEFEPVEGEELDRLAREVTDQPPDIVARLKRVLGD
jgi:hypothetical protein